jgi:hydroxyacylglutathione hydrolase
MLTIHPVSAFNDNYLWVLSDGSRAAVVDPGDAAPVEDYLDREHLELVTILLTHHHADHIGGVAELVRRHSLRVYAPHEERIAHATDRVRAGDRVTALGATFEVIEVPGHTRSHIAYHADGILLCGDTLFVCGCGRMFEGTAPQMHASLMRLAALPPSTRVYCAHEYTLSNIRFARAVEPDNGALAALEARCSVQRGRGEPTVPSTLAEELATNPFLRCAEPAVAQAAAATAGRALASPIEVFATLREWKNTF